MNEQEMEQIVSALERYFDHAHPSDHAHNARLIQADLERHGPTLLLTAPAVMLQGLRNLAEEQTARAVFGADEAALDRELQAAGLFLLMTYASLLRAAGTGGVLAMRTAFPILLRQDEAAVTLMACAPPALGWVRG